MVNGTRSIAEKSTAYFMVLWVVGVWGWYGPMTDHDASGLFPGWPEDTAPAVHYLAGRRSVVA
jgi:hypothetical protein